MAICPHCEEVVRPVIDEATTPDGGGKGVAGGTWVCPECDVILGVSEVDML
jgi:phage terminase large subunit GpA-like protein